jgi:tetratricopeptide (TPR) repeat protein
MQIALGRCAVLAGLCAAVVAAFWPAFGAQFVNWDDFDLLLGNPHFRGFGREHWAWMFTTNHVGPFQPLTWVSYACDHALYGLADGDPAAARGFHATSVALHAATACALHALARRLLRHEIAAVVAALLFAVHPLRVESVVWVTERRDVLSGLFTVLTVLAWVRWKECRPTRSRARAWPLVAAGAALASCTVVLATTARPSGPSLRFGFEPWAVALGGLTLALCVAAIARAFTGRGRVWLAVAALLYLAAMLSKASGMTLPAALVALELWKRGAWGRWSVADKLPLASIAVTFGVLAYWGQAAHPEALVAWSEHTAVERGLQACFGLVFYVAKSVWPGDLIALRALPDSLSITEPRFALAVACVTVAAFALVALRRRVPSLAAGVAIYALLVAPMLGLAQCGPQLVADRYSYVPAMPLALLAAGALVSFSARAPALALVALASGALGVATQRQAAVWHDSERLWRHTLAREPASAVAHAGLADALKVQAFASVDVARRRALLEEALQHFEAAFDASERPRTLSNAAVLMLELAQLDAGRAVQIESRALELARRAVELAGQRGEPTSELRLALGVALFRTGRFEVAVRELEPYVEHDATNAVAWSHLGVALAELGRFRQSIDALRRATALRPDERSAWWYLGRSLEALGDRSAARAAYAEVLRIAPDHTAARERVEALH